MRTALRRDGPHVLVVRVRHYAMHHTFMLSRMFMYQCCHVFFTFIQVVARVHVSPLMTISWMRPLLCDGPHCWLVIFGLSGDDVSPPELLTSIQPFIFVGLLHTRVFLLADFATSMFSRLFPIAGNIGRTTNTLDVSMNV